MYMDGYDLPLGEPLFNRGGGVNRLTDPSPSHDIPGTPANLYMCYMLLIGQEI
jgi:hypothetical protein